MSNFHINTIISENLKNMPFKVKLLKVKLLLAVKGREVLKIVVDVLNKELRRVMGRKENVINM